MGAGKSTVGAEVARLAERPFVDTDEQIERQHGPIPELFARGEAEFRRLEEDIVGAVVAASEPAVIALGGGAVLSEATRELLGRRAYTVWLDVDPGEAWRRAQGGDRPLARDETEFRRLFDERLPVYDGVCDEIARDADGVLLASLCIAAERGIGPSDVSELGGAAWVVDENVLRLHGGKVGAPVSSIPAGEDAKTLSVAERLYDELEVGRDGTVVAFGGGCTTDVAGYVAATYLRGIRWIAVPTTLVGQVDAAIGGKTGIDLQKGKNLVGAFHYPARVVIDPELLRTLPEAERRAGMAEVVKTGLLAGRPLWELPDEELVRACAAFKAAVCLGDPYDRGRRAILNLGHTFAHALEAASEYGLRHGDAVALGLLAALRLSGQPTVVVEELLRPEPARVDPERAWAALGRDKKAQGGRPRLVLLEGPGKPVWGVELPDEDVRRELERLIA